MALSTNLAAYWKLDETGGTIADSTGGFNITSTNSLTYSETGKINTSISANANGDYATVASCPNITGNWSINVWLYRTGNASGGNSVVVDIGSYGANNGFGMWINTSNYISWRINQDYNHYKSSVVPDLNSWNMITLVYNGTNVRFYKNGTYITQDAMTTNPNAVSNYLKLFNREGNTETYVGRMDELGVWSKALSDDEVTSLYNSGSGRSFEQLDYTSLDTPTNLSNSSINTTSFQSNWDSVTASTSVSYISQLATDSSYVSILTSSTGSNIYTPWANLTKSTDYYWRVMATASSYFGSDWATSSATTLTYELLDTPTNLSTSAIDYNSFQANWNAVTASTSVSYITEVSTDSSYLTTQTSSTGSNTYVPVTGLSDGVTYYWRVSATASQYSNSPWATTSTITLKYPTAAISKAIYLNEETISSATLQVNYTGNSSPSFYLSPNGGINWEEVTNFTPYTFTTSQTTTSDLRWKIISSDTSVVVTQVKINY